MKKIFNFGKKKGQSPSRPFIKVPSYFGVQTPYPTEGYQIQSKDLGKIHKAALLGDVAKVQQLLLLGKSTVNDLDKMKRTPLHLACANGYPDVVSLLVERKCELNLLDNDNRTPLMKAIECRQEECATILLEHGADPNLRDENNDTILHYVASSRTKFMAEILIKHKIDIEAVNKEGLTPLLLAITTMNTELADFLLKNGANVNALDSYKRTALMIAVSVEALGLVTLLLQNNADYTLQDISGWTAQTYAERYGYPLHIYHKQIEKQKEHIAQEREQFEKEKLCLPQIICSEKPSDSEFALCAPSLDKKAEGSSAKDSVSSLSDKPGSDDHLPSTENELDFDMKCSHENLLEISAKHKVVSTNQNAKDSVSLGQHEDHPGKIPSAKPIQSLCEIKDTFTNQEVEGLKEIEPKLDFIEEFDLRDTDDVDDLKQKLEYKGSSVRIQENFDKRDQEQRSHENFLEISARRVLVSANQNIKDSISLRQHEDLLCGMNGSRNFKMDKVTDTRSVSVSVDNVDHLRRNSNGKPIQPSLQMKDSFTNQEIGKRDTSKWDSTSTSQIKESHKSSKDMMLQSNYSVKSLPLGQNQLSSTRFAKIPAIKGEAVLGIGPVIDYKVGVQLEKPVLQKECSKDMKLQNDFPGKSLPLSHNQLPSTKVEKIPTVKGEAVVGIGPVIDYKVGIQLIKPVRQKECSKDMKLQSNYPGKSLPLSQNQLPSPKSENIPSQEDENAAAGSEPIIDYKEGDHLEKTVPQKQCESFLDKEKWKEVKKDLKQELKFKGPSELSEASSALANNLSDSVEKEKDKDSLSVGDLQSFPGERVDIPENVFFQNLKINFPKNVFQFSSNMCSKRSTPQSKNKPKIEHTCNVNEDNIGYVAKNIKRAGSKLGINEIKEDRSFGIEMTFSQHKNITNLESDSGGLLQSSGPGSHFGGQLTHSGDIASINQEKIPELITARKHKEKTKHTETSFQNSHHNATNSTNELRHGRHSLPHEDQISKMHLDKELKQDKQILTNELGMLQAESLTLEKEKIQPQKKMEEKRQKHQQKQMETLERKDGDKLAGKANEQFSTESHQHGNDEENKIPGEEIPIMSISSEEKLTPVHHILKGNWREKLIQKHRRNCYSLGKFEEKEIKIGKNVKKSEDENCISKDSSTTSENVNSSSSSIFDNRDDSTLNETDPDELRLTKNILNEKNKDKVEMATDAFDDFTQSQDTGTEDYDLLPSHYVQGSPCLQEDQNTVLASDLSVKVKKSQWKKLPGKIKSLEKAIRELQKKFSERSKTESQLEHQKVECDRELYRDRWEDEKEKREKLHTEIDYPSCVSYATFDQEHQTSKLNLQQEEWLLLKDQLINQTDILSIQLSKAEEKIYQLRDSLRMRTLILEETLRELKQTKDKAKELEHKNRIQKEKSNRSFIEEELMKERITQIEREIKFLKKSFEDAPKKGVFEIVVLDDMQFRDRSMTVDADTEKQDHVVEEKNKESVDECIHIREQIHIYENEQAEEEDTIRKLKQEQEPQKKPKTSLNIFSPYQKILEWKNKQLQKEVDQTKNELQKYQEQNKQKQQYINDLEDYIQKLKMEYAAFEDSIKEQMGKAEKFQKNILDSTLIQDLKGQLEAESSKYIELELKYISLQEELFSKKMIQKKCIKLGMKKRQYEGAVNVKDNLELPEVEHGQGEQDELDIKQFVQTHRAEKDNFYEQMEQQLQELKAEISKMTFSHKKAKAALERYREQRQDSGIHRSLSNFFLSCLRSTPDQDFELWSDRTHQYLE